MSSDLLSQFNFPREAEDFISKVASRPLAGARGVDEWEISGQGRQVPYRFFIKEVKSERKSEEFDMEINDDVEMIQWFKDKNHKPVERVTHLPTELLRFAKKKIPSPNGGESKFEFVRDAKGKLECKGGLYAEAYKRFQEGLGATGLPLERWDRLSLSQIASLKSEGVFTVEQFAALPDDRVEGRFPKDLEEKFKEAVHFVNAKERSSDLVPYANEIIALKQESARKEAEIEALKKAVRELALADKPKRKRAPRKANASTEAEAA